EAHDLAEIRLKVLRRVELLALAGADPEMAVPERDAVAVMPVARDFRHLAPDHVEILEQAAAGLVEHEPRPRDGRAARAAFAGLRITHVYEPVLRIGRVQDDIAEPALTAVAHVRHAVDLADRPVRREELESAAPLGDEQPAVRQERHRP